MDSFGALSKSKTEWAITNGQFRDIGNIGHKDKQSTKDPTEDQKERQNEPHQNQNRCEPMGSRVISSSCFWLDTRLVTRIVKGSSWSWSYGCWIYNYLCNQSLSPLRLWVRVSIIARCTRYNIMWLSLSVTCGRSVVFSGYFGFLNQ